MIINLRSDTQTLPTEAMLEAIRRAPLGDDVFGEDPTVRKLEDMAASRLGKEAGLLVVSGTMGNLVSLMAHSSRGDEVIVDLDSHIFYHEVGSIAAIAGLMPMPVRNHDGMLDPDEVAAAIRKPNIHYPQPRILCLENTHNRSGGRIIPLDLHKKLCDIAHERGLKVHLDGARIFNAEVATGIPASEWAKDADSVMFCLSKGLSCPIGSLVVGDSEFIAKARRYRKQIGGGMRQAGIIAACGIVALETMVDRLAEDHANAKHLAQALAEFKCFRVDVNKVETNMVYVDHSPTNLSTEEVLLRLEKQGVLASGSPPNRIRFVTHRHIERSMIKEAVSRIKRAMESV